MTKKWLSRVPNPPVESGVALSRFLHPTEESTTQLQWLFSRRRPSLVVLCRDFIFGQESQQDDNEDLGSGKIQSVVCYEGCWGYDNMTAKGLEDLYKQLPLSDLSYRIFSIFLSPKFCSCCLRFDYVELILCNCLSSDDEIEKSPRKIRVGLSMNCQCVHVV